MLMHDLLSSDGVQVLFLFSNLHVCYLLLQSDAFISTVGCYIKTLSTTHLHGHHRTTLESKNVEKLFKRYNI
jgi:hypothetical protein